MPRQDITGPMPMVISLCFGGDDLRDPYVVTGSEGAPTETSALSGKSVRVAIGKSIVKTKSNRPKA